MAIKTMKFDTANYFDADKAITAFPADALESSDAEVFQESLNMAARARGIVESGSH